MNFAECDGGPVTSLPSVAIDQLQSLMEMVSYDVSCADDVTCLCTACDAVVPH